MGTNFYLMSASKNRDLDPSTHIGKRSAAGPYCWDCRTTLCSAGEKGVHYERHSWLDACPKCGKKHKPERLQDGAAGRELGFNSKPFSRKKGVASCSSFSWAMPESRLERVRKVKDEYGRVYTKRQFMEMLEECPIRYTDMIGKEFC